MHRRPHFLPLALAVVAVCSAVAAAQDTVSKPGCVPGDAILPWDTSASTNGSEQRNDYVVDLTTINTSWGTPFGIAPIIKASKSSTLFFNSLISAQGMSRKFKRHTPYAAANYGVPTVIGQGINNDSNLNDPMENQDTSGRLGNQFGVVFREGGATDNGANYHGIVTGLVTHDPADSLRLHVRRIQAAVNGCDNASDHASLNAGAVDEDGNCVFRCDQFGVLAGGCNIAQMFDVNIFMVDSANRDPNILNHISGAYPAGLFDAPVTKWVVRNIVPPGQYNTPTLMPASVAGQSTLLATNFANQFERGPDFGLTTIDSSHLAATITGHRGALSYMSKNFAPLASTHGTCGIIAKIGSPTDVLNVFGLNSSLAVTGKMGLVVPAAITDNATGDVSLAGGIQFDHYHSQTAFQGGNGQVSMGLDVNGNLLVAAQASTPYVSMLDTQNIIAVAKVDPLSNVSWTMAGYTISAAGPGKPILDGPGGNVIGRMVGMDVLTGGSGPSVSAPMTDAAGNIWFLSATEIFVQDPLGNPTTKTVSLLRAVYDPSNFSYELELVLKVGDVNFGANTGLPYVITDLRIRDSDSVDSGTAWSGNISDQAYLGYNPALFGAGDPRGTGGLVVQMQIRYDRDQNGLYEDCQTIPTSTDETYRVLMYVGPVGDSGMQRYGTGCPGTNNITPILSWDGLPTASNPITLSLRQGLGGSTCVLVLGLAQASAPLGFNCFLNVIPILPATPAIPLGGTPGAAGQGGFSVTLPLPATTPPGVSITMQGFVIDPFFPRGYSNTPGLQMVTQ